MKLYLDNGCSFNLSHVFLGLCVLSICLVYKDLEHEVVVDVMLAVLFIPNFIARSDTFWVLFQVIGCDWKVVQNESHSIPLVNLLIQVLYSKTIYQPWTRDNYRTQVQQLLNMGPSST